jgi:hypothetical protein
MLQGFECVLGPMASARDTMAELNRRGQVCETLAGTGVRVAKNGLPSRSLGEGWSGIRVSRPVFRFGRSLRTATIADGHWRVSLNTYAQRENLAWTAALI